MHKFIASVAALVLAASGAWAESRVALVIGNAAYENAPRLANPRNDAEAVAEALRRLGFDVVRGADLDTNKFRALLGDFGNKADRADVAVVYYAGHAIQVGGVNYVLPVDAKLERERDLNLQTIPVEFVLGALSGVKVLKVVMLDACRDNPFAQRIASSIGTRSAAVGRGLAVVQGKASDTLIAYATGAGEVAADGAGRHSPFTAALLAHIDEPGLEIRRFFGKVSDTVRSETKGRQEPYVYTSLGGDAFYWRPGSALPMPATTTPLAAFQVTDLDDAFFALKAANLRAEPSAISAQVGRLEPGAEVAVTGKVAVAGVTWYRVAVAGGKAAFVHGSLLAERPVRPVAPVQPATSPQSEQTAMVAPSTRPIEPAVQPAVGLYYHPGQTFRDCTECPEMVVVPAGFFDMGDLDGSGDAGERPVHRVTIPYAFAVGKYEVTQAEWRAVMGSNPSRFEGDRNPVERVSWSDAQEFVKRLSSKAGQIYRMLSEAEWEYVARAGSRTNYPWGNGSDFSKARYGGVEGTRSVGSYAPNGFGLFDTAGNVWEWVQDCSNRSYAGAPTDGSVWTAGDCGRRVLRGGAWNGSPRSVRSAVRNSDGSGYGDFGLRVARSLPRAK